MTKKSEPRIVFSRVINVSSRLQPLAHLTLNYRVHLHLFLTGMEQKKGETVDSRCNARDYVE